MVWEQIVDRTGDSNELVFEAFQQATARGAPARHTGALGAGAPLDRALGRPEVAAPVPGFVGFDVGRAERKEALRGHVAGTGSREETVHEIVGLALGLIGAHVEHARRGEVTRPSKQEEKA